MKKKWKRRKQDEQKRDNRALGLGDSIFDIGYNRRDIRIWDGRWSFNHNCQMVGGNICGFIHNFSNSPRDQERVKNYLIFYFFN